MHMKSWLLVATTDCELTVHWSKQILIPEHKLPYQTCKQLCSLHVFATTRTVIVTLKFYWYKLHCEEYTQDMKVVVFVPLTMNEWERVSIPEMPEVWYWTWKYGAKLLICSEGPKVPFVVMGHICDMIKWKESDIRNIDFELQTKTAINAYMFYTVLNFKELVISLQPDVWLRWDLDQNVTFKMDGWLKYKNQNRISATCDSFPLIMSHIVTLGFLD